MHRIIKESIMKSIAFFINCAERNGSLLHLKKLSRNAMSEYFLGHWDKELSWV